MLQNRLDLTLGRRLGADRRIAQHTIVKRHLRLGRLLARIVLAQGNAVIQIQMEMLERSVLHAQRTQSGTINLDMSEKEKKKTKWKRALVNFGALRAAAKCTVNGT